MEDTATRIARLIANGTVRLSDTNCPQCKEAPLLEPFVFNARRRTDGALICHSCRDFNLAQALRS